MANSHKRSTIDILGKHNHFDVLTSTIERQVLRENCKRKIVNSITMKPNKIIPMELITHANTSTFERKDVHSVRKALCIMKRYYPKFLQCLNEAPARLQLNQNKNCFKYKGEQFTHICDNESIVCLTNYNKKY